VPPTEAHAGANRAELPGPEIPPEVEIMLFRSARVRGLLEHQIENVRGLYERPRLVFLRHGYQIAEFGGNAEKQTYREGIDIINAPYIFLGERANRVSLALRWGAADAYLENDWSIRPGRLNVLPLILDAEAQKLPLQVLSNYKTLPLPFSVPSTIGGSLTNELAQGNIILAPSGLINEPSGHHYAWWSIDRATGLPLGRVDLGGGQGMLENAEHLETLIYLPEKVASFFGAIDRCYFNQINSSLAGAIGGNNVQECVKRAACDVLAAVVAQAAKAGPVFFEAEEEEEVLAQIIQDMQQYDLSFLSEESGEHLADAACEALGGP
jgi:hypothetical protein